MPVHSPGSDGKLKLTLMAALDGMKLKRKARCRAYRVFLPICIFDPWRLILTSMSIAVLNGFKWATRQVYGSKSRRSMVVIDVGQHTRLHGTVVMLRPSLVSCEAYIL